MNTAIAPGWSPLPKGQSSSLTSEAIRKQMAKRAAMEAVFETDMKFMQATLSAGTTSASEIQEWTDAATKEHWERMAAYSCPRGSVGIWKEEEMVDKRLITIPVVILMLAGTTRTSGVIVREENDSFTGSDDYYTQGLEVLVPERVVRKKNSVRMRSYGIRNLMYTPTKIGVSENQPNERPWAGLTAIVMEEWRHAERDSWRSEWMVGVLGEWSQSDHIQTWFHDEIGVTEPKGWHNQIPNEPFVNVTLEYYRPLYAVGGPLKFDATGVFGGSLGTAFVNGDAGVLFRGGWHVPDDFNLGLIKPTVVTANELSAYVFVEGKGRVVLHNATLGGSLFRGGPSRRLRELVGDLRVGISVGINSALRTQNDIRLVYSAVARSKEFEGQAHSVDYGSVLLSVTRGF